jgi:hypothetical protein
MAMTGVLSYNQICILRRRKREIYHATNFKENSRESNLPARSYLSVAPPPHFHIPLQTSYSWAFIWPPFMDKWIKNRPRLASYLMPV